MTFLRPELLPLTALAALPVLFHLFFRIRRRRYKLPTLRFLQRQQREESSQRLRELLLLLIRTMVLLLAALAFARPAPALRTAQHDATRRHLVILLDRSMSMEVVTNGRARLTLARENAERLLRDAPAGTRLSLIAVDDVPEVLASGETDRGRVVARLREIESRQRGTDLAAGLAAVRNELLQHGGGRVALLTDWQASGVAGLTPALLAGLPVEALFFAELAQPTPPNTGLGRLLPVWGSEPKLRLPAVGVPGGGMVRREVQLSGTVDGRPLDRRLLPTLILPPVGQAGEMPLAALPAGDTFVITARLEPQDALAADDMRQVTFRPPQPIALRTAIVPTAGPYLAAGLAALAYAYPPRRDGQLLVGAGLAGVQQAGAAGSGLTAALLFADDLDAGARATLGLAGPAVKESAAPGQAWRLQAAAAALPPVPGLTAIKITTRLRLAEPPGEVLVRYADNLPAVVALPGSATRPATILVTTLPQPADGDLTMSPVFPILLATLLRHLSPAAQGTVLADVPRAPDGESDLRALAMDEVRARLDLRDAAAWVEAGSATGENEQDPAQWWRYALGGVLLLALLELVVGRRRMAKSALRAGARE